MMKLLILKIKTLKIIYKIKNWKLKIKNVPKFRGVELIS